MTVKNKRIVVAGTGPLLLAVADYLRIKGGKVVAIAEQAPSARVRGFALGLWNSPAKLVQAGFLRARLISIPYLTDSWVTAAAGNNKVQEITLFRDGKTRAFDCDILACGYHLVPNTELGEVLGCTIREGFIEVDEFQKTSLDNIYCAGEPTGIGGVEASLIEGTIAGLAASGRTDEARSHFARRNKTRDFGDALDAAFALRDELKTLALNNTVVCRCDDVEYGRLTEFTNFRDAKLQTRCGMGPCQGRICGPALKFMFGWKSGSVRPPIFPVKMENL